MGNGVSNDQGNLPSYGKRDVSASVCKGQHDWSDEQAEAPETHSLSTGGKPYTYTICAFWCASCNCFHGTHRHTLPSKMSFSLLLK